MEKHYLKKNGSSTSNQRNWKTNDSNYKSPERVQMKTNTVTISKDAECGFNFNIDRAKFKKYVTNMALMHKLDDDEIINDLLALIKTQMVNVARGD